MPKAVFVAIVLALAIISVLTGTYCIGSIDQENVGVDAANRWWGAGAIASFTVTFVLIMVFRYLRSS